MSFISAESGKFGVSEVATSREPAVTAVNYCQQQSEIVGKFRSCSGIRKYQSHGPQRVYKPLWQTPYWTLLRSFELSLVLSLRLVHYGQEIWFVNKGQEHCYVLSVSI